MNRKDKVLLAISGFMGGIGFTMLAFHFNHKDILNESPYISSMWFLVCLVFCLRAIFKEAI
jgi:predicted tellurium resistance membrane protein TerC